MAIGFMEVQLVKAKGLRDTDIFGKMDPYVLIQYKGQEKRSGVANGKGKNPVWNEKFIFKVEYPGSSNQHKLILKIMDKDLYTDDFVGEAIIHVGDLLAQGVENGGAKLQTLKYRVVRANKSYCGEIDVGVTFTRKVEDKFVEEDIGGWKENYGILFPKGGGKSEIELLGYLDSNWCADKSDRKSTIDYCSKKEVVVVLSSCEAENIAASMSVCQGVWLDTLMQELQLKQAGLTYPNIQHHMGKINTLRLDFISLEIKSLNNDKLVLEYWNTVADIYPKALKGERYRDLREMLGVNPCQGFTGPRVVRANNSYCGEIDVGVTFTPQVEEEIVKEDIGGWKESDHCLPQISKAKI
ncbi:Elicitor-responsive protein 1 [Glycine max]|nr:Elicitor-responsive protein 1 [Glycine max]